jgi:copper/silver efflux system protein
MTTAIIRFVIRYRTLVWLLVIAAIALSIYAIRIAPLDAIPDISDPQIIVYAKWARSPQLLEAKVAAPVIDSLVGSPGVRTIRATSHMGYCFIYVILDDESQRQMVQQ